MHDKGSLGCTGGEREMIEVEIWIGKRFFKDLRECTLVNLKTGQTKYFLATEDDVRRKTADSLVKIKKTRLLMETNCKIMV